MGQDIADVQLATVEVDRGDQPILVAPDVEDHLVSDQIGARKRPSQLDQGLECRLVHDGIPRDERPFAVWVQVPKLMDSLTGDDMHLWTSISQNEI